MRIIPLAAVILLASILSGCAPKQAAVGDAPDPVIATTPVPIIPILEGDTAGEAPPEQPGTNSDELPSPRPEPMQEQAPGVREVRVPVLLYHHLDPEALGENGAVINTAEFEWQMAWLQEHGYTAITTLELGDWLEGRAELPDRPVLITFDDGYASNYHEALPILQRYGMKATIFLIGSYVGLQVGDHFFLRWPEIRAMVQSGLVEFQGHTYEGHYKVGGQGVLVAWTPEERRSDLQHLAEVMSAEGLSTPFSVAYPFGEYDDTVIADLQDMGYSLGFTVKPGFVRRGDDPFRLKRKIIFPGFTVCDFERTVTGEPCK